MILTNRRPPPYTLPASSTPGAGIASNWTASEMMMRCIELLCDINATVLQAAATARKSLDEPAPVQRRAANAFYSSDCLTIVPVNFEYYA